MYPNAYLTRDLPGIGGVIKSVPEDFVVHEIPLYEPEGVGEHVYVQIEKRGLTTFEAVARFARALRISDHLIGYAGLKDSRAVTRQMLSIHNVDTARVEKLRIPQIRILSVSRHTNKLRTGHLFGNRFIITVREADPEAYERAEPILRYLEDRGMPNAFGVQRFGSRRDAHRIGRALCFDDPKVAVDRIIGNPSPLEHNTGVLQGRRMYEKGDLEGALQKFPAMYRVERALLRGLLESGGRYDEAVTKIDKKMRRLYIAAFQSHLFNMTLWRRIDEFDVLMPGDLAYKHANGSVFPVEEHGELGPDALEERRRAFDISPSGPLHGYKMVHPIGRPRFFEDEVLRDEGLEPEDLLQPMRNVRVKGERRALRVPVREVTIERGEDDTSIVVGFVLPRGCYATILLREVMKTGDDNIVHEGESYRGG